MSRYPLQSRAHSSLERHRMSKGYGIAEIPGCPRWHRRLLGFGPVPSALAHLAYVELKVHEGATLYALIIIKFYVGKF